MLLDDHMWAKITPGREGYSIIRPGLWPMFDIGTVTPPMAHEAF